ncbi:MAG: spermidine/putrescine ABC transporter ATP-binding protein [Candidatus Aminicenantes bacterium RBG_16_63_16]|nr:MAG: spermidine/putrescine ABC transporter ATP-binding protein [Candidatus Aminicenantes bacterium RBG_16_63_16]
MSEFLEFRNVSKRFGEIRAVDGVSLEIKKGEFFSLLGPSGCGKTTMLRLAAGFEQPDSGRIILDGADITDVPPHRRQVNTIFQSYALFPHLSVRDNIAFGLEVARRPRDEIGREVENMLRLIGMTEEGRKKPAQLSGGQRQRVAVARALVNKPQVLLLDEPLAALDLKLRQRMLIELDAIHDEVGITFLYVTHDQEEAMSLSDRLAVMEAGRVEQVGAPAEIYEAPRTSFVAAFIGDTNFLEGEVMELEDEDYCRVRVGGIGVVGFNDKAKKAGSPVYLSIRPEKIHISRDQPEAGPRLNVLPAVVEDMIYLGSTTKYWVRVMGLRVQVLRQHSRYFLDEKPIRWNDPVWIWWHGDDGFMLDR